MTELIWLQYLHLVQVSIYFYKPFLVLFFENIYIYIYIFIAIFKTSVRHVHEYKGC